MNLHTLLFAIGLLYVSCQLETKIADQELSSKKLTGRWIWYETSGAGIAGPYKYTAKELGHIEFLDFKKPSELHIQRIVNNEILNEHYSYTITETESKSVLTLFSNNTLTRKEFIQLNSDTLKLSNFEPCCDNAYESVYVKAKGY